MLGRLRLGEVGTVHLGIKAAYKAPHCAGVEGRVAPLACCWSDNREREWVTEGAGSCVAVKQVAHSAPCQDPPLAVSQSHV